MRHLILLLGLLMIANQVQSNTIKENFDSIKNYMEIIKENMGYGPSPEIVSDDPDPIAEIDHYLAIFLEYSQLSTILIDTEACRNATKDLAYSLKASIANLENVGFNKDSYLQLTQSLGVAQPFVKVCFNTSFDGYKKASEHFSDFSGAGNFFANLGLNIGFRTFQWIDLAEKLQTSIKEKNTTEIVIYSAEISHALFDFENLFGDSRSALMQHRMLSAMVDQYDSNIGTFLLDLVYNFFKGAHVLDGEKTTTCQANATDFYNNVGYAIDQFKDGSDDAIYRGVATIADQFAIFHDLNSNCIDGYEAAVASIQAYARVWNKPFEIISNVVWGYRKVYKHMTKSIQCAFDMDAECAGLNSGYLVYYTFSHNPK